jgi:uncharacterized membrane protein YheB (UPF0754 family)
MHTNNSGKDEIALKIANVVIKIFLKQKEIISLRWKNEYEDGVSDSSNEDMLQKDSKAAPSVTANVEALTNDAAKDELIHKEPRTSKRQKKPPTIKSDDFFMVNDKQMLGSNSITIFHQNICEKKKKKG